MAPSSIFFFLHSLHRTGICIWALQAVKDHYLKVGKTNKQTNKKKHITQHWQFHSVSNSSGNKK